jgi:hypothetical protein
MQKVWALLLLAAAAPAASRAEEEQAEQKVVGRLSAKEGLTLAGRVLGGSGPVGVTLWRYEFEDTGRWYHRTDAVRVEVPPGGEYRFSGLAPGRYDCCLDEKYSFAGFAPDVLLVRDVLDHDLRVPSECRLKGRVTRTRDDAEGWVTVSLGYYDTRVAADGSYETPDVPPGDYVARVRETWPTHSMPRAHESVERAFAVRLDGVKTLDVALEPDVPIWVSVRSTRRGEEFEGHVGARSDRVRVEQGWFRVVADGDGTKVRRTRPTFPHGADGWSFAADAFLLDGLAPGRNTVLLSALGFAPWEEDVDVDRKKRVEAEMTALRGQFLTAPGLPTVARIETRPARGAWTELTSQDRRMVSMGAAYESPIVGFVAPGRYEWRAESVDGTPTPPAELVVTDARDVVKLQPVFAAGAAVRGRLATKSGHPLGGVRLRLAVQDGAAWRVLPTKDTPTGLKSGSFETKGLSPGRWRIALDDACEVVLAEFDVKASDVTKDLVFAPR